MSDTLRLAMFKTLRQKIEDLPEVVRCHLHRFEEVGQNESKPVIILWPGNVRHSYEEFHAHQVDAVELVVEYYVNTSKNNPLIAVSEPIRTVVDYTLKTEAPKCSGVRSITPVSTIHFGESGWLGFVRSVYIVEMAVQQLNLTAAAPP